jgi:RNA polymerase sigma-70 factor (ECF subfamily)
MSDLNAGQEPSRKARFAALVEEHYRSVYRFCFWLVGPNRSAEDLCQQVFLAAWQRFEQLRNRSRAKSWLMRIALNAVRTEGRRIARRGDIRMVADADQTVPCEDADPAGPAVALDRRRLIYEAVQSLPEERRAVVILRVMQGLSGTAVSQLLGVSEASVSRWKDEGLEVLRSKLLRSGVVTEGG